MYCTTEFVVYRSWLSDWRPRRYTIYLPQLYTPGEHYCLNKVLAAHYGIPETLPPAPRTSTAKSPLIDFQTLSSSYLSMLSWSPSVNTKMTDPVAPLPTLSQPRRGHLIMMSMWLTSKLLPAMLRTESSLDLSITVSHLYMEFLAFPHLLNRHTGRFYLLRSMIPLLLSVIESSLRIARRVGRRSNMRKFKGLAPFTPYWYGVN